MFLPVGSCLYNDSEALATHEPVSTHSQPMRFSWNGSRRLLYRPPASTGHTHTRTQPQWSPARDSPAPTKRSIWRNSHATVTASPGVLASPPTRLYPPPRLTRVRHQRTPVTPPLYHRASFLFSLAVFDSNLRHALRQ